MSPAATHERAADKAHSTRRRPEPGQGERETGDAMLALQAGAGNQAVQALLGDVRSGPSDDTAVPGQGRPLDAAVRAQMGAHFGDLSQVRIHTGPAAATSADALGASAYTVGRHIVFGHGEYAPGDLAGRALIAHELAHVAQQARGGAAPASSPGAEQSATASATSVIAGGPPATADVGAATGVARQPKEAKEDRYEIALRANKEIAQGKAGPAPEGWPVDESLRALWSKVDTGSTDERSAAHRPATVEFIDTVARYQAEAMGRSPAGATGVVDPTTAASLRRTPIGPAAATAPTPAATQAPATGATSAAGETAAAEPGTSLGVIASAVVRAIIRQATGGGIQHRMLAAAIGGFITEMGRQLTGKDQIGRFKSALAELLVPRNLLQFYGGYLGGLVAGFVSPVTDLLGLGVLAEQLPSIAIRLGKTLWEKAQSLGQQVEALGKAFAELPGLAWKALSAAAKDPKSIIEFFDAAGEQAVTAAGGAGKSAAQAVVGYFSGKEEEQEKPAESIKQVFTSSAAEERRGFFSAITSKASRLRKSIFSTPWSKIGYNVGHAIGAVVSNVLLLIFSAGIGNVIAKVGAWLGKLAPLFARVGELVVMIGKVITALEGAIGAVMGKLLKPLEPVLKPLAELLERLTGFLRRLLGVAEQQGGRLAARGGAEAAAPKVSPKGPDIPEPSLKPDISSSTVASQAEGTVVPSTPGGQPKPPPTPEAPPAAIPVKGQVELAAPATGQGGEKVSLEASKAGTVSPEPTGVEPPPTGVAPLQSTANAPQAPPKPALKPMSPEERQATDEWLKKESQRPPDDASFAGLVPTDPSPRRLRTTAEAAEEAAQLDLPGFQTHSSASGVRKRASVTGLEFESAHIVPQSVGDAINKIFPGKYSPGKAKTMLLPKDAHKAFDNGWVPVWNKAVNEGRQMTVGELHTLLNQAIDNVPNHLLDRATKGAMAERLWQELFRDLDLRPDMNLL